MTAVVSDLTSSRPAPDQTKSEQQFFLSNVPWESYVAIGNALPDRPGLRITYDRGAMEFMTTSPRHDVYKRWLGRFFEVIAEELDRPIAPGGSMTFQDEGLQKAIEGDECYWITHEEQMRCKGTWDPKVDPPPDVFIEIEVSRSVINRLALCAALRIPEVWAFNGQRIRVYRLERNGNYQVADKSQFFPEVPLAEIVPFLNRENPPDYLTAIREFRSWLRRTLGNPPIS